MASLLALTTESSLEPGLRRRGEQGIDKSRMGGRHRVIEARREGGNEAAGGREQVQGAVVVQIGQAYCHRVLVDGIVERSSEGAVAVAVQHRYAVGHLVGQNAVGNAVAV